MTKRYEIWDRTSPIITVTGEYYTPQEWIEQYPAANYVPFVCQKGETKGAFFQSLSSLIAVYETAGLDFSNATTDEEKLELIEDFEDTSRQVETDNFGRSSPEERIAAALEAMVMD